jgi:putative DNA primase/helicase
VYQDALVVPMYIAGCICGCQLINGEKKFLYGQRTNDAYFQIGNGKREFIVEGFASGLSLQEILAALKVPATIYITFSAGNALLVAKAHPDAFFCADHDESGVGQRAAEESGCKWWMPEQVGWDVNDLHVAKGLFAASQELRKRLQEVKSVV